MRQSLRLGRVAGIEIGAHWSVLVIAVLLGYGLATAVLPAGAPRHGLGAYLLVAIVVSALFLAGLLGHELAHALVAQRRGVGVHRITLWLLGGVSELDDDPPTPRAELLIAAAGPAASLVFGGLAAAAAIAAGGLGVSQLIVVALTWLAVVNLFLAVFNLLPGAPLDGGRIVRAVVWRLRGDRDQAQIAADHAGVALGILLASLGVLQVLVQANLSGVWLILLGWFLVGAANAETAGVRMNRALGGRSVRDIMAPDPVYGVDSQSVEAFVAGTAARRPHATYPVVDIEGRLVGLVRLTDIARIPASGRSHLPLRAALTPAAAPVIGPGEPASTAARSLSPANPLLAVTENDRLVGVVSSGDVANAIALSMLGQPGDGHAGGPPTRGSSA
jgi:Zn-dependent protease/CBS domain-containing protein